MYNKQIRTVNLSRKALNSNWLELELDNIYLANIVLNFSTGAHSHLSAASQVKFKKIAILFAYIYIENENIKYLTRTKK